MRTIDQIIHDTAEYLADQHAQKQRVLLNQMLAPIPSYENPLAAHDPETLDLIAKQVDAYRQNAYSRVKTAIYTDLHQSFTEVGKAALEEAYG